MSNVNLRRRALSPIRSASHFRQWWFFFRIPLRFERILWRRNTSSRMKGPKASSWYLGCLVSPGLRNDAPRKVTRTSLYFPTSFGTLTNAVVLFSDIRNLLRFCACPQRERLSPRSALSHEDLPF